MQAFSLCFLATMRCTASSSAHSCHHGALLHPRPKVMEPANQDRNLSNHKQVFPSLNSLSGIFIVRL
jgi:hypothetical protein